jgi:hypothetical protein
LGELQLQRHGGTGVAQGHGHDSSHAKQEELQPSLLHHLDTS